MYVWSIREQHAPNVNLPVNFGIHFRWQIRRGRYCLSHQASSTVQTIRYGSFPVRGPMLLHTLLSELRNMTNCSSESFTQALDTLLKTIPDEPQTPGYTYMIGVYERIIIVWSIWLHLPLPDIPQYRKSLTTCHKIYRGGHPWSPRDSTRKPSTSIEGTCG